MKRKPRSRRDTGRDPGGFMAVPWTVLDSAAYQQLSHPAKALLFEIARQCHGDDNGRLLASIRYLRPRGWKAPGVILRAKRELLDAGFIHETVKGHRPSKASWYAVTWRALDRLPGFDAGAESGFVRGSYLVKNRALSTSPVVGKRRTATSAVLDRSRTSTSAVAVKPFLALAPSTSPVHPLDKPSIAATLSRPERMRALAAEIHRDCAPYLVVSAELEAA